MKYEQSLLFLGTGGSLGVPVIGCSCAVCLSSNPCNIRSRPGALLNINSKKILIDAGPDFRAQALRHQINSIDGVIFTHAHNDHTAGIDDLRVYYMKRKKPLPCLMSEETYGDLQNRFYYIFSKPLHQHQMTSKLDLTLFPSDRGMVKFLEQEIHYFSYEQSNMKVNGIRLGHMAYVTDIKNFPETIYEDLNGVKILIISALRNEPSALHFTVDDAIAFAEKLKIDRTWLIHVSHDLDHDQTNSYLPRNVRLAYDGLEIKLN